MSATMCPRLPAPLGKRLMRSKVNSKYGNISGVFLRNDHHMAWSKHDVVGLTVFESTILRHRAFVYGKVVKLQNFCVLFLCVGTIQTLMVYLNNRPQVSVEYKLINHAGRWQNTRRICKPRAAGEWFTNSCGLLLLYNNSEDARYFRGFTGTITHS